MTVALVFAVCLAVHLAYVIWIDFRHFIIPDAFNLSLFLTGSLQAWWIQQQSLTGYMASVAFAGGLTWLMREAYVRLRGVQGLGLGDVKFMAAAGAWLAIDAVPLMLFVSCVSGLCFVLMVQLFKKQWTATSRIAFGPHLALGLGLIWGVEQFWP